MVVWRVLLLVVLDWCFLPDVDPVAERAAHLPASLLLFGSEQCIGVLIMCLVCLVARGECSGRAEEETTKNNKKKTKKNKQSRANRILLAVSVEGQRAGVARRFCADGAHSEIGHRSQRKSLPVICVRLSRS